MIRRKKAVNYLSNKELMREIHKSKTSFCEFDDPMYQDYDLIVASLSDITKNKMEEAKANRAERFNNIRGDELFDQGLVNKEIDEYITEHGIKASDIDSKDVVFRIMTNEHIPTLKDKKGKLVKASINFPAFQHFIWRDNNWVCVGKSHFQNGKFCVTHGKVTRKLAQAYLKLVEKYGNAFNWRNYTWNDDLRGQALVRLSQVGLQYNEFKTNNPFSYLTTVVNHSFTYVLNKEKENVAVRARIIQESGYAPSFNEQAAQDHENYARDNASE